MAGSVDKFLEMGQKLKGKLQWQGGGTTSTWVKKPPSDKVHDLASMVCWMAPLYVAYQAGVADKGDLQRYEQLVNVQGMKMSKPYDPDVDGDRKAYEKLYLGTQQASHAGAEAFYRRALWKDVATNPQPAVNPGEMVYFFRPNYAHAVHYAVCTSSPNVLSLWTEPSGNNHLQECSIQALLDVIRKDHGSPIGLQHGAMPWA